jgi:hypothetical protein
MGGGGGGGGGWWHWCRTYYEPTWTSPPENVQRHSCAPPRCQNMVQAQTGESSARPRTSCLPLLGGVRLPVRTALEGNTNRLQRALMCAMADTALPYLHRHLLSHVPNYLRSPCFGRFVPCACSGLCIPCTTRTACVCYDQLMRLALVQ